ncbi:MAG: hypothetical protein IT337_18735 [Thermomicrobiales bacterium]|nr:hypothetical protein [Thermomicrobiales bacterium]
MADATALIEQAPLQDRDLLQRLSLYFDTVDHRLRHGEGWFIFNAKPGRSRRIAAFIQARLNEHTPPVSYFVMPWRDFALSAYVTEVGLPELAPSVGANARAQQEFDLAIRITHQTWTQVVSTDLLVLVGMKPAHRHEAELLDRTIERRHEQRLATILLTPDMPQQLEDEFRGVDPAHAYWWRIFNRMYESSLVAL